MAQDPSGEWRTLHSPHFRVHFRPADRIVAQRAAREAERAWSLLATELVAPHGTVDLTLADNQDIANGFTSVTPSNRITVFLTPPALVPELQRFDDWLRLVTTHELTHVFHLDRTTGWWRVPRALFGRLPGLFPNAYQPSWVTEGLAVYYESKFTNGGRIRGAYHTQLLAAASGAGTSRNPWNAVYFTEWPDGTTPYAYGSRFFRHFADTLGDSVVPRFVERTSGQLFPYRVGRQVRRASGRSDADLAALWAAATRPAALDAPAAERIAAGLWTQPVPRVSPAHDRVAFVYDDGKTAPELRVVDARNLGRVVRRHRVNGLARYDWLGDTLVVTQLDFTSRLEIRSDLYRWLPDGRWRRATHGARLTAPRAGGGVLATVQLHGAGNAVSLPVRDTAGVIWGEVVPSPDGRQVVATRHQDGHWALVRWTLAAPASLETLFESSAVVTDPVWRGDAVLFVSEDTGLPQVYLWEPGHPPSRLGREPLGARAPAPLADGSYLFTTLGAEGWELRLRHAPVRAYAVANSQNPTPFDSAPSTPLRETGYSAWPSLRPHFWIPLFADAADAGRFFGGATAGSDAIGRWTYGAAVLLAAAPLRADGGLFLISRVLDNPTLDVSASQHWSLVGVTGNGTVVAQRGRDAAFGIAFEARRWRSFARLRVAAEYEGRHFFAEPAVPLDSVCTGCTSRDRVGGSATLTLGHVVTAPLAVSPIGGVTWSLAYRRRDQQGSPLWSNEVRMRLNAYRRVPGPRGFGHPVLALRLAVGATSGPIAKRLPVGGVSGGFYDLGFGQTVGTGRTFPVRGFAAGVLDGRRAATAALEYRVPLALVSRAFGHLPLGLDRLSLAPFAEVGDAWEPGQDARLHRLKSAGAELVTDLLISYDLPLTLRAGVAQPLAPTPAGVSRRARAYVALAADF